MSDLHVAPHGFPVARSAGFATAAGAAKITRKELRFMTADGMLIAVREIKSNNDARQGALILLHAARVAGPACFDLPVPHGSLAADLAECTGRTVYTMDARGYGASERQRAMERPPEQSRPLSRAFEVVRDIDAVVSQVLRISGYSQVALFGWATGGMWASFYASLHPEVVSHLIVLNSLYGGSDRHAMMGTESPSTAPAWLERLKHRFVGYAFHNAASLVSPWDRSIPVKDKIEWRDPLVARAYENAALASDPTSFSRHPPSVRAPTGPLEDSYYQATGRRLFDASSITSRVLLIRSELDVWSRPEDVRAFQHDAARAIEVRTLTLANATLFVHLDRPEHGRDLLIGEIQTFLARR